MIDLDRTHRWRATAETWVAKAASILATDVGNADVRAHLAWEAGDLLRSVLDAAETLASLAADEQVEELEGKAKALAQALRARRLAGKLDQTNGRTEEEATMFREKAAALRGTR